MQSYATAHVLQQTHFLKVRAALDGVRAIKPVTPQSSSQKPEKSLKPQKKSSVGKKILSVISSGAVLLALITAIILFAPDIYYRFFPAETLPVISETAGSPLGGSFQSTETIVEKYQPPFDALLPEGDWIIISRIGVRTQLLRTQSEQEALDTGVWWVPDFGVPGDTDKPMILAAHRFGWRWWWNTLTDPTDPQSLYALRNSFYNLPSTEPGDQIEIISGQRKYVYEIYSGEESHEISDYSANLILYTCKFLNSPIRHVRYARLINPGLNTQESPSPSGQVFKSSDQI